MAPFKIKRSASRGFYYILTSRNNQTLMQSEVMERKQSVIKGITAVITQVSGKKPSAEKVKSMIKDLTAE